MEKCLKTVKNRHFPHFFEIFFDGVDVSKCVLEQMWSKFRKRNFLRICSVIIRKILQQMVFR